MAGIPCYNKKKLKNKTSNVANFLGEKRGTNKNYIHRKYFKTTDYEKKIL